MMSEKENKFKKEIEEIYKSQKLEKEIFKPTEKDIRKYNRISLVLKILGYFFIIIYLIAGFKIEPMYSYLNKIKIPNVFDDFGLFDIFFAMFSLACIYHAVVDMFQRLKKLFKKDNE